MAAVWTIDFSIKDRQNAPSHVMVHVPATNTAASVAIFANALAPLIEDMISGAITGCTASLEVDLSSLGLRTAALDEADREEGALFVWLTQSGYFTKMRIPTFKEDYVITGTKLVDLVGSTQVSAFVTMIEAGNSGVNPSDSRADDIVDVSSAVEDFKRYKKTYVTA